MPATNQNSRWWVTTVEVVGMKHLLIMFKNTKGVIGPYSVSGRTLRRKEPFGPIERMEISRSSHDEGAAVEICSFSNGHSESFLATSLLDPLLDQHRNEAGERVTTSFGQELEAIIRTKGNGHAVKLLTCLSRSRGFAGHNPEIHENNGVFKEEGEVLTVDEENNFIKLANAAFIFSQLMAEVNCSQDVAKKIKVKRAPRSQSDTVKISEERVRVLETEGGLQKSSEDCHEGVKLHPLSKLIVASEIVRKIDEARVDILFQEMSVNLDPSQIIFKAALPIKRREDFNSKMIDDNSLELRVVSGRHRLLALQRITDESPEMKSKVRQLLNGKGGNDNDEILVPVVLLSITGVGLTNYEHLKTESASQKSQKVLMQDYIFLCLRIRRKLKDDDRAVQWTRNIMLTAENFNYQALNSVLGVCKLPLEILQQVVDVLKQRESYETLNNENPSLRQRVNKLKLPISQSDLKIITKTPVDDLKQLNCQLIEMEITWKEYLKNCNERKKLNDVVKVIETQSQLKIEELLQSYPEEFSVKNLKHYLYADHNVIRNFINKTLSNEKGMIENRFTQIEENLIPLEGFSADVCILRANDFEAKKDFISTLSERNVKKEAYTVFIVCNTFEEAASVVNFTNTITPAQQFRFKNVLIFPKQVVNYQKCGFTESVNFVVACGKNTRISTTTLQSQTMERGLIDVIHSLNPNKVSQIAVGKQKLIDVTSPKYETEYFATCSQDLVEIQKRNGRHKMKIKEEYDPLEYTNNNSDLEENGDEENGDEVNGEENNEDEANRDEKNEDIEVIYQTNGEDFKENEDVKQVENNNRKRKAIVTPSKDGNFCPKVSSTQRDQIRKSIFNGPEENSSINIFEESIGNFSHDGIVLKINRDVISKKKEKGRKASGEDLQGSNASEVDITKASNKSEVDITKASNKNGVYIVQTTKTEMESIIDDVIDKVFKETKTKASGVDEDQGSTSGDGMNFLQVFRVECETPKISKNIYHSYLLSILVPGLENSWFMMDDKNHKDATKKNMSEEGWISKADVRKSQSWSHYNMFPRSLGVMIDTFHAQEFLFQYWRYSNWGHPLDPAPPGALVTARILPTTPDVDTVWAGLTSALAGLLNAPRNTMDKSQAVDPQYSLHPMGVVGSSLSANSCHLRYGVFSKENLSTENLTPWKELLLLSDGLISKYSIFQSVSPTFRQVCADLACQSLDMKLSESVTLAFNPAFFNGRSDLDNWSLIGVVTPFYLANSSQVYVDIMDSKLELSPPSLKITDDGWSITFFNADLYRMALYNSDEHVDNRIKNINPVYTKPHIYGDPLPFMSRHVVGTSNERGDIVSTNTGPDNLQIVYLATIPWFLRHYLHTMKIISNEDHLDPITAHYMSGVSAVGRVNGEENIPPALVQEKQQLVSMFIMLTTDVNLEGWRQWNPWTAFRWPPRNWVGMSAIQNGQKPGSSTVQERDHFNFQDEVARDLLKRKIDKT